MFSDNFVRAQGPAEFEVGAVLGQAFSAMRRNWAPFTIYVLALYCVPALFTQIFSARSLGRILDPLSRAYLTALWLLPVNLVMLPLCQSLIAWTIWADSATAQAGLIAPIGAVARRMVTILLADWFRQIAQLVGFVLFLVPGIMVLLAFQVLIPVCAVESHSIGTCLQRALYLSRGQRWRILLLWFALIGVTLGVGVIVGLVTVTGSAVLPAVGQPIALAIGIFMRGFGLVFGASCVGAAYVELLRIKGGGAGAESTAAVFA